MDDKKLKQSFIGTLSVWVYFICVVLGLVLVIAHRPDDQNKTDISTLQKQIAILEERMDHYAIVHQEYLRAHAFKVDVTAYTLDPKETSSNPHITATMTKSMPGRTAAVSQDLVPHLLGRKIYVPGSGVWKVEDVMHPRHTGMLDLCFNSKTKALQFGVRTRTIVILE